MSLKKGDFVEIEFTGSVKGGEIFDSNIKEDLDVAGLKGNPVPFTFCLGEKMFIPGVDSALIGKEIGEYNFDLKPEEAFGKRDPKLIKMVPLKNFLEHKVNPIPGAVFEFDGKVAKVLTVSGGRVMIDFNHPLSGKKVTYKIIVKKKVDDMNEKITALNDFFFRKTFDFEVKDKELKLKVQKELEPLVEMFKDKYESILGLKLIVEKVEKQEKKQEKKK